jgi:DNA-binding NarL/FixJ family response regulator
VNRPTLAEDPHRPIRILIADDHEPFRHALAEVITAEPDMEVVAEAADGEQAVWLTRRLRPERLDLLLLDINMPRLDGIRAAEQINATDPALPIVMLTVSLLERSLFDAMRAGAVGYLSKGIAPRALVRALRDFCREGALPMSRVMARTVLEYFRQQAVTASRPVDPDVTGVLSSRERQVLGLIAEGAHDREIAEQLVITERTVKKHVQSILRKLHARNRAQAVARLRGPGYGSGGWTTT